MGYAGAAEIASGAAHATLPIGTFVEVTALDTGRTVLLMVKDSITGKPGQPIALSPEAMQLLGIGSGAPVRVRGARPSPPDVAALRNGQPATARLDAPPVLLAGLRKELPAQSVPGVQRSTVPVAVSPTAPDRKSEPKPAPARPRSVVPASRPPTERPQVAVSKPKPGPTSGWGVQIAALSSEANARALASQFGGRVSVAGKLYRVQLGPFTDRSAAESARAAAVRRGQTGAALVRIP